MNSAKLFLLLYMLGLLTFFSCKRSDDVSYTFENFTGKTMNVAIYASLNDYNNGTNVVLKSRADVRGYYAIPYKKLTTNKMYYVDVYSDDYLYNNWYTANAVLPDSFSPTTHDTRYAISDYTHTDLSRVTWLNGAGPQTNWKAFDAYTYSGGSYTSIWSTLSGTAQDVSLLINKSTYCTLNSGGAGSTLNIVASYDTNSHICSATLLNTSGKTAGNLTAYFNSHTHVFNASKDTMLAYFTGIGYFAMARQ